MKQWRVYAKDIGIIEIHYVLNYLSSMFDKRVVSFTINNADCVAVTILHILTYQSKNKHPLVRKYIAGISKLRPQKTSKEKLIIY